MFGGGRWAVSLVWEVWCRLGFVVVFKSVRDRWVRYLVVLGLRIEFLFSFFVRVGSVFFVFGCGKWVDCFRFR